MNRLFFIFVLAVCAAAQNPAVRELGCSPSTASGTTYGCNIAVAPAAYSTNVKYWFVADVANTGAATINFNSLGAKAVKKVQGGVTTALVANDIQAGQYVLLAYDGTNMQMLSGLGNAATCPTCVTSAASLTNNAVVVGGGGQGSATIPADTTTTHALYATAAGPAFRATTAADIPSTLRVHGFGYTFSSTSALTAGLTAWSTIPVACAISAWTIHVFPADTATVDVWMAASGTSDPTVSNTITASAIPAITTGTTLHSTTLTGWTTSVPANANYAINLKAVGGTATTVTLLVECDQ